MHLHKAEIRLVNEMLFNFGHNLHFIFINTMRLCSCRNIVPSEVTLLFLQFVQGKLLLEGFWDLLGRFPSAELTNNILVMMNVLQILVHVLGCGFSMVLVLCHNVKIQSVLDSQQGFCDGNPVDRQRVWKSCNKNWNNHLLEWFLLLPTTLHHLAIWLVESSEDGIWRNHRQC